MTNQRPEMELYAIADANGVMPIQVLKAFERVREYWPGLSADQARQIVLSAFHIDPRAYVAPPVKKTRPAPPPKVARTPTKVVPKPASPSPSVQDVPERQLPPDAEPTFDRIPLRERLKAKRAAEAAT